MGHQHSKEKQAETADKLYYKETTKKGLKAISALGASILLAPAVMLALPLIGAYEFSSAVQDELITGHFVVDGMLGGLFGVIVSPLAPFYCFLISIQDIFDNYRLPRNSGLNVEYLKRAKGMLGLDYAYYNVVITGSPGTGKSFLLNGLLGYRQTNKKAAKTGEIETTLEPKSYKHPILNALYLWDMPGIGTPRHPTSKHYFDNYCLGVFDAILIVFDDRLMASDIEIARRAKKFHVPVFFIKNKSDIAIEKKMQRMKKELTEDEKWAAAVSQLTLEIKSTIYKNMRQFHLDTNHLYIISAHALQEFVIFLIENAGYHSEAKSIKKKKQQRIIHEKVLITNLLDTLAERRNERKAIDNIEGNNGISSKAMTKKKKVAKPVFVQ